MSLQPPSISQSQDPASDPRGAALCLVFTDARGRVVFADNSFIELIRRDGSAPLVGEPLHRVLGSGPQHISQLIAEVARLGYVHHQVIESQGIDGHPINIACTGVATYDDHGAFIGADLTLCDVTHHAPTDAHIADHGDILSARIKAIQGEVDRQRVEEVETFVRSYFTAQVSALQVLLARMGGTRVREMVETLVNQAAQKQSWPVQMHDGHVIVKDEGLPLEAYAVLLDCVIDYGASIIGQQTIVHEMQAVDGQTTDPLREIAGQAGLRRW
jgi:hypothetical protein